MSKICEPIAGHCYRNFYLKGFNYAICCQHPGSGNAGVCSVLGSRACLAPCTLFLIFFTLPRHGEMRAPINSFVFFLLHLSCFIISPTLLPTLHTVAWSTLVWRFWPTNCSALKQRPPSMADQAVVLSETRFSVCC